jgi:hypothetical protein
VEYMKELLCELDTAQHLSISEADINETEGHSLKKEKKKKKKKSLVLC